MESGGRSLGGRAYLIGRLQERGLSRRKSVRILNEVFNAMSKALQRGRNVEFPFGRLVRVKRHFSDYWDSVDDLPANQLPYTVEHELDEEGERLLNGIKPLETRARGRPKSGR